MPGDAYLNRGDFIHNNTVAPSATDSVLPLFKLTGRTAIVSGAGAGIGLAIAQALAEAGANVAIWYNSNKKAIDEAAKIEKAYGVKCESPVGAHIIGFYPANTQQAKRIKSMSPPTSLSRLL